MHLIINLLVPGRDEYILHCQVSERSLQEVLFLLTGEILAFRGLACAKPARQGFTGRRYFWS